MKSPSFSAFNPRYWARLRLSMWRGLLVGVLGLGLSGMRPHGPSSAWAQSNTPSPSTPTAGQAGPTRLPSLGDGSEIPLGEERRLGDSIMREVLRDPDVIDDPLLADYVGTLWQRLREAARQRGEISTELEEQFSWALMLIRDKSVNAFALPGGYMGVHLGLVGVVATRDELASVLAHELSHITQRHIARLLTQQQQQTPMVMAAMIVGLLAASRNPQAAQAMMVGGQAVAIQNQLNFSRDMEREADRVGYGVANQAGFEPAGFVTMFEKLLHASRLNDSGGFPYLRSHPLTTERIADMQARQQLLPATQRPEADWEHALMSARARVLANPGMDAQRHFSLDADSVLADPLRRAAALYAAVLADTRLREHDRARQRLGQLTLLSQGDPRGRELVQLLAAEVSVATGQALQAVALLEPLPLGRATQVLLAQARVATGLPAQGRLAAENLQKLVGTHPRESQLWDLLGQALGLQGDGLRSLRAQAEASALRWDYAGALDRLKAAQELVRARARIGQLSRSDEMEAAIIDARARLFQSARREQMLQR